ncbi:MAG TPA: hypothetical protein VK669_04945 [Candidatus Limnocylindrales bacterium]|nr:hypothetical protein [Candidatus Limnocylindrales bacterium]
MCVPVEGAPAVHAGGTLQIRTDSRPVPVVVQRQQHADVWKPDDATAYWTCALALATVLLAVVTVGVTLYTTTADRRRRAKEAVRRHESARRTIVGIVEATATRLALAKSRIGTNSYDPGAQLSVGALLDRALQSDIAESVSPVQYAMLVEGIAAASDAFGRLNGSLALLEKIDRDDALARLDEQRLIRQATLRARSPQPRDRALEEHAAQIASERRRVEDAVVAAFDDAIAKLTAFRNRDAYRAWHAPPAADNAPP